jgi:hypothetical protein
MGRLLCFAVSTTWLRLCALMLISLAAIAITPVQAKVKIGFQAPLTGAAATDGVSAKIAAEMANEKINSGGGVLGQKIELVTYDDQAKTEEAVFTANKLVGQDGVKFAVSGSYSASGRAAAPIFQKASVPFISAYGVHPDITRSGDYVFRGVHLGPPQGEPQRNSSATILVSSACPSSAWTTTMARPPSRASRAWSINSASRCSVNTAIRSKTANSAPSLQA